MGGRADSARMAGQGFRSAVLALFLLSTALAVAACDPYPPTNDTGAVEMNLEVDANGGARAELILDRHRRTRTDLVSLGQQLAPQLFPTATRRTVGVDDNLGGYPYPMIKASGVYRPGPHPQLTIDTRTAAGWLLAHGTTSLVVRVGLPTVSTTAVWSRPASGGVSAWDWTWYNITRAQDAPYASITLTPATGRSLASLALLLVVLVLVAVATISLYRRRRGWAALLATSTLALVVFGIAAQTGNAADNLGVAGVLSDLPLRLVGFDWVLWLGAGAAGVAILLILVSTRPSRKVQEINPPPGWPLPPPGWAPVPGWQPDPQWPAAPPGWEFYRPRSQPNKRPHP